MGANRNGQGQGHRDIGVGRRSALKTLGLAGGALALGDAAPSRGARAQAGKTKIVYDLGGLASTFWPVWVAQDLGYFDQAGVEVSLIVQPTTGVNLLLSGDAHVFGTALDFVGIAIDKGADIIGVSTSLHSPTTFIAGKGINSVADLKGKRLGVTVVGSADSVLIDLFMNAGGIKKGDYEIVAAGIAAMTAGASAATTLTQPADIQLVQGNPDMKILPDTHGAMEVGSMRFCTFVNKSWAQKNHAGMVGFLKAQIKACQWLADPGNRDRANAIQARETKLSLEASNGTYDMYDKAGVFKAGLDLDFKNLTGFLKAAEASGEAKFKPSESYFDATYLNEARQA